MEGKYNKRKAKSHGVAILPLVIIASFLLLIIGSAIVFVAFFENQSAFSARKKEEARTSAYAGVNDALRRLILNRNFESPGGYSLTVNNNTVTVVVRQNVGQNCSTMLLNSICIESLGRAQNRQSKIRVMVSVDSVTGQLVVVSVRELAI